MNNKIITFSNTLREVSKPVDDFSTIEYLIKEMTKNIGVGISAIQIGVSKRVLMIQLSNGDPIVMINPVIEKLSEGMLTCYEGCLSLPSVFGLVDRPNEVKVSYVNEKNEPQESVLVDFEAGIFLHEYDHLGGILFIDRCFNRKDRRSFEKKYRMKVFQKEGYDI